MKPQRRRAPRRLAALVAAGLAAAVQARAEPLYVIEQLVVNVNSAPDASGERIATVKSGERLEVIERAGSQVHVRLADGQDGWIRAAYLTADEPLRPRLAQSEAQVARLKDDVSRLEAELRAARAGPAPAAAAAAPAGAMPAAAPNPAPAPLEDPGATDGVLFGSHAAQPPRRVWPWALGAALAGLGLGFALGALALDRHVRRKYGGLRIY